MEKLNRLSGNKCQKPDPELSEKKRIISMILKKIRDSQAESNVSQPPVQKKKKCNINLLLDSNSMSHQRMQDNSMHNQLQGIPVSIDRPQGIENMAFSLGGSKNQQGGFVRAGSPQSYLTCSNNQAVDQNTTVMRGDVSNSSSELLGYDPSMTDIPGKF